MKTPFCLSLFIVLACGCSSIPRAYVHWQGGKVPWLGLGQKSAGDPRDPVFLENGKGLSFDKERGTLARIRVESLRDVFKGPFTVAVLLERKGRTYNKAGIISLWRLVEKGRCFELGIYPEGNPYFTASGSGSWPRDAVEVGTFYPIKTGRKSLVSATFVPGKEISIYVDGELLKRSSHGIPNRLFIPEDVVLLGNRPGSFRSHAFHGIIYEFWIFDKALGRKQTRELARSRGIPPPGFTLPGPPFNLDTVRKETIKWYKTLRPRGSVEGVYSLRKGLPPGLYASVDIAWIRWIIRDLDITREERASWIAFINGKQKKNGVYTHRTGHCRQHAFCHSLGALRMLGGDFKYYPSFMEKYKDPRRIPSWLQGIDWKRPWGASHEIWGAGLPIACSPDTPGSWKKAFFGWLDSHVDPSTGFWCKGIEPAAFIEKLGGSFHIWPIYVALNKEIPYPERVIDSILKLRKPNGSFDNVFGYGNMDGVWALSHLYRRTNYRHEEVKDALTGNARGLMEMFHLNRALFFNHAHTTLSRISALALIQEALPEIFVSRVKWRNPWCRKDFFALNRKEGSGR